MGVIAWRTARSARERESARVELLKALAFPDASAGPHQVHRPEWPAEFQPERQSERACGDTDEPAAAIFAERAESVKALPRGGWRLPGSARRWSGRHTLYADASREEPTVDAQHDRGPGQTDRIDRPSDTVRARDGLRRQRPRSQSGGAAGRCRRWWQSSISSDADGRVITSQMTPLERPVLEAGQTSAFSLVFPRVTGAVARYQVGFRLHGGDTIPHVDRRAAEPARRLQPLEVWSCPSNRSPELFVPPR